MDTKLDKNDKETKEGFSTDSHDLTKFICVSLKVINGENSSSDTSEIKVSINEKVSKIVNIIPGGGTLIHNGKQIEKPDEVTFAEQKILEGSKFGLMQSTMMGEPVLWKRFKSY